MAAAWTQPGESSDSGASSTARFTKPPWGRDVSTERQGKGENTFPHYKLEPKGSKGHAACLFGSAHFICMETRFNIGSSPKGMI